MQRLSILCFSTAIALLSLVEISPPTRALADDKTPAVSELQQLEKSLANWTQLKEKCEGNYTYLVRRVYFVGATETEVVVANGKVIRRSFRTMSSQPVPQPIDPNNPAAPAPDEGKWVEEGDQIGTHTEGAPAKTIDQWYTVAKEVLEKKLEPHERRYLRFDDRGIISHCFYVDTRIADDAPTTGVFITKIELAKTPPKKQ